jgi:RHS repeat-associated protein
MLQPRIQNPYAVFMVQQSEMLSYTYERNPADPRIVHNMTIATDEFGNVLQSAVISYGRKTADTSLLPGEQAAQSHMHIVYTVNNVTNKIDDGVNYHLPLGYESVTYELTGITPATVDHFVISEVKNGFEQAAPIAYEALPTAANKEKRLIKQARSLFLKNDMTGPLPLGVIESLVLPYQSYKLSLTPGLRDFIFGSKVSDALLLNEGKYVHFNDDNYWIASGTQMYDAANFYQVTGMTDPFGFTTQIVYDSNYHFFVQKTIDALNNESGVEGFNFRILSSYLMKDMNDNRNGVRMNELGMVTSTFVMGKEGENKGDLFDTASVEASENDRPSQLLEYDVFRYANTGKPNFIKKTIQETHHYESLQTGKPVISQISYTYLCGNGKEVMQKKQAEPGIALQENADGTVTLVDTTPDLRWIGNGRTILNNKGKPVKQYEPYFSVTFEFEDAKELVERGVTPVITYDSAGRVIRTDMPDGTFTKVEFDAWMQRSFDQNDTVLQSQWYSDRITAPVPAIATPEEVDAAGKAEAHANTPAVTYLDSLGRGFLMIANNGPGGKYKTTTDNDIEGNMRSVTDARGNVVMQYKHDMLGAQLYHTSMDAGERWIINDVMGKLLRSFDSRSHVFRYEYDSLHRPVKIFMRLGEAAEINTEKIIYGETVLNGKTNNLLGKPYQLYDAAGVVTNTAIDFKGNRLSGSRQLLKNYKDTADWNVLTSADTEPTVFATLGSFDALNRPIQMQTADGSVVRPVYNEAGILNQVFVSIKGMAETQFVKEINYDAKGQRINIVYGNDTATTYQYNPKNFRLTQLVTTGKNGTDLLQQLQYTYDPAGNITTCKDQAQQTIFFNNTVVNPSATYTYDAIYRLIEASGREHIGQNQPPSPHDEFRTNLPMPGDGTAMRNYSQSYQYDAVGNILQMIHAAGAGSWTRTYDYETASNRLTGTTINNTTESYSYDAHGNIQSLFHLSSLTWNYKDQLQQADLGGGGTVYYVYDSSGQRVRKVIERQDGTKEERIYLGCFELFRKTDSTNAIKEQTETLHIIDDSRRIAMVETKTVKNGLPAGEQLVRYQYSNQLGSTSLELDSDGTVISYEEYHPFGTTAYQAINAAITAAYKRYRYTGMERDDETGLEYHSARYYLPWLGRWLSADPIGLDGGINLYAYCDNRVIIANDPSGNLIWFIVIGTTLFLLMDDAQPANAPGFKRQLTPEQREQNRIEIDSLRKAIAYEKAAREARQPRVEWIPVDTQPRHSDWDMPVKGAIMAATAGMGGGATTLATRLVGKGLLAETAGLATFGAANSVGLKGYDDIKRGEISSFGDYAVVAVQGAVSAIVVGHSIKLLSKIIPGSKAKGIKLFDNPKNPVIVQLSDDEITSLSAQALSKQTGYPIVKLEPGSLEGVDQAVAIGHGTVGKQLAAELPPGLGASGVQINGASLGAEAYAEALHAAGWRGGQLVLGSCRTGLCNVFGSVYGADVANELGALSAPTTTKAPMGDVDFLGGVPKVTPQNGIPEVITTDAAGNAVRLAPGKGWVTNTATMQRTN